MASWNIAIVGVTNLTGQALIELLQTENTLAFNELFVVDDLSTTDISDEIRVKGKQLSVQSISSFDWSMADLAIFAVESALAAQHAEIAADAGCIVLDLSGHYSHQPAVPLIVPSVNDSALADYRSSNMVALAHPVVSQLLLTLAALGDMQQLTQLHCSTYLPASIYGKTGIDELAGQSARLLNGMAIETNLFQQQLAFNLLPMLSETEQQLEMQLLAQCQRILGHEQSAISFDLLHVPVFYGLAQQIQCVSTYPTDLEQLKQQLSLADYVQLQEDNQAPTPVTELDGELTIKLSHLRYSPGFSEQLQCWAVSDNIRFLSAKLALDVADKLLTEYR